MKRQKAWINGRFIDIDKAKVSIFDRGFLYGDGAFETMRGYAGIIFRLDEHLNRFFDSLKVLRIRPPYDKRYLKKALYKSLKINNIKNAYIRLSMTRGEGRFDIGHKGAFTPNVVVATKEFEEYPAWMYRDGLSAKIVKGISRNERSILSNIKSLNFLTFILARLYAKEAGFDEAILMNAKGHIAEAATSNVFLVKREKLVTPSLASGILPGITRGVIIEIAKRLKIRVMEKLVTRRELLDADEIFLTNSLAEVLPVTRVDSSKIASGRVGDLTKLFRISYQKQVIWGRSPK